MSTQQNSGDSWEPMNMEMKTPTTYSVASHPEAMNHPQPQTTRPKYNQQAFRQPGEGKLNDLPGWSLSTTTPMSYDAMNSHTTPLKNDYKLPEGAYYGTLHVFKNFDPISLNKLFDLKSLTEETPVFQLDAVTGEPTPTTNAPIQADVIDAAQFLQSRCSDPKCSNCENNKTAK